ncbi:MAG: M28 family peptidase [Anaerolineaceae bacterium]
MKTSLNQAEPNEYKRRTIGHIILILCVLLLASAAVGSFIYIKNEPTQACFNGESALKDVQYQVSLGARTPDSEAHVMVVKWLRQELTASGWQVEEQDSSLMGHPIQNVVAKRGTGLPWIILGAHYDSRMLADHDPDPALRSQPVPAANDGASGVAVLVELARSLPKILHSQTWLVFFDAEDQGDIKGWDWILGSRSFAQQLSAKPDAVVVIDMIGDKNLDIYYERNSTPELSQAIWSIADQAGYQHQFIPKEKYSMEDDHTPFLEQGIRAVDIIDFDYPYWHTTADTLDKVSAESLHAVGDTLFRWILTQ